MVILLFIQIILPEIENLIVFNNKTKYDGKFYKKIVSPGVDDIEPSCNNNQFDQININVNIDVNCTNVLNVNI
jgi:hypothetical protein